MSAIRNNYQLISAVALVVGVLLISIAEASRLDWTRVFGATAISLGAIGIGVYVGLTQPGRWAAAKARLAAMQQPLGILLLILLFLPALAGLLAGIVGLFGDTNGTGWVIATGGLILILMLIATVAAFVVGLLALSSATTAEGDEAS